MAYLKTVFSSRRWHPAALLTLLLALQVAGAAAQAVPRAVLVEHFTNTVCSVCASRNPGFYANLRQQTPPPLHVAYHPSSPYRACQFSQQNLPENDARTNFYGVYGSTPRLVLNGAVVPAGQNYAAAALFAPYQNQSSPFAVSAALQAVGADSIAVVVQVETRAAHAYATLQLYLPLVQDTVFYAAPNGEQRHYDVFRKSFSGPQPLVFAPAAAVGGRATVRRVVFKNPTWTAGRLYALAIVQDANRQVVQAGASPHFGSAAPLAAAPAAAAEAPRCYPNPAAETCFLAPAPQAPITGWQLQNLLGQTVAAAASVAPGLVAIDVRGLAPGPYLLRVQTTTGRKYVLKLARE